MDITNFWNWFINEFITIGTRALTYLDSITILGISILKFTIYLTIIGAFINILLTVPQAGARAISRSEKKARKEKK